MVLLKSVNHHIFYLFMVLGRKQASQTSI